MGCDIHFVVEKFANNEWVCCNPIRDAICEGGEYIDDQAFYDGRDYTLFGKLAGVRDSVIPISPPRGIPEDVARYTRESFEAWDSDAHSASWYSLEELLNQEEYLGEFFQETLKKMQEIDPNPQHVRCVFWFDN